MSRNYWASVLDARMNRRKTLAATGALAAGAAFLAACGGSDSGSGGGKVDNSLLTKPADTTKMAKKGGVMKRHTGSDPAGLDPHGGGATVATFYEIAYARLFNYTPGLLKPSTDEIEGAHAESWEFSPDRLTLTAKLRQGTKFHNIAAGQRPRGGRRGHALQLEALQHARQQPHGGRRTPPTRTRRCCR